MFTLTEEEIASYVNSSEVPSAAEAGEEMLAETESMTPEQMEGLRESMTDQLK